MKIFILLLATALTSKANILKDVPEDFAWGVATAAY